MYNEETMKIGVNSRIYQNSKTGIPNFIECLYKKILEVDKKNQYVFFQTDDTKKIGLTKKVKLPNSLFGIFLFDNFLINQLIESEKINVFHGPANILPFFRKKKVKYLLTVHDLSFLLFPQNYSRLFNLYYKYFVERSLDNADVIVTDSKSTKNDIKKFYRIPDNKIKVIYLGVNNAFFKANKKKRLIKDKYFFSVKYSKRKNTLSILKAMVKNEKLLEYKFVIAGLRTEHQLKKLKEKVKELHLENNVILFGYATERELISLYQNAEFFIYPSFYEGFGFPVLEAMACKCPVITSDNSSLREITPDKEWLVDPYNLNDISNKINKMLSLSKEERSELIQKNYNFAQKFTWERTVREYIKIFSSF